MSEPETKKAKTEEYNNDLPNTIKDSNLIYSNSLILTKNHFNSQDNSYFIGNSLENVKAIKFDYAIQKIDLEVKIELKLNIEWARNFAFYDHTNPNQGIFYKFTPLAPYATGDIFSYLVTCRPQGGYFKRDITSNDLSIEYENYSSTYNFTIEISEFMNNTFLSNKKILIAYTNLLLNAFRYYNATQPTEFVILEPLGTDFKTWTQEPWGTISVPYYMYILKYYPKFTYNSSKNGIDNIQYNLENFNQSNLLSDYIIYDNNTNSLSINYENFILHPITNVWGNSYIPVMSTLDINIFKVIKTLQTDFIINNINYHSEIISDVVRKLKINYQSPVHPEPADHEYLLASQNVIFFIAPSTKIDIDLTNHTNYNRLPISLKYKLGNMFQSDFSFNDLITYENQITSRISPVQFNTISAFSLFNPFKILWYISLKIRFDYPIKNGADYYNGLPIDQIIIYSSTITDYTNTYQYLESGTIDEKIILLDEETPYDKIYLSADYNQYILSTNVAVPEEICFKLYKQF